MLGALIRRLDLPVGASLAMGCVTVVGILAAVLLAPAPIAATVGVAVGGSALAYSIHRHLRASHMSRV